ncbi:MAG: deoxyguanosinetriphosphate triphosphohydrolase [Anaerovoracaceae bacterium]
MITRVDIEKRENEILSEFACKASDSFGRDVFEEKCNMRTDFQRDRDRIIHSKAFRRLMHKTQVFLAPEGDHFRTRLTHTIEVSQIARTIARGLALNEDLTEAIALGHDLGHTPFGHNGELILNHVYKKGFRHNEQSIRVVEILEDSHGKGKRGMNLTKEVRDGILNHTGAGIPFTLEGQIVKISDRVAYINHDIDDALRSGVIKENELPQRCIEFLGDDHRTRIDTLVKDLIVNSDGKDKIGMSEEAASKMNELRTFMFQNVYHNNVVKKASDLDKVENIITSLYEYFVAKPELIPKELLALVGEFGIDEVAKDYIAGMTDRYAINLYDELFIPKGWK